MKVELKFENTSGLNMFGLWELERIFNDLVYRLSVYWDNPRQDYETAVSTELVVFDKNKNLIGKLFVTN